MNFQKVASFDEASKLSDSMQRGLLIGGQWYMVPTSYSRTEAEQALKAGVSEAPAPTQGVQLYEQAILAAQPSQSFIPDASLAGTNLVRDASGQIIDADTGLVHSPITLQPTGEKVTTNYVQVRKEPSAVERLFGQQPSIIYSGPAQEGATFIQSLPRDRPLELYEPDKVQVFQPSQPIDTTFAGEDVTVIPPPEGPGLEVFLVLAIAAMVLAKL